MKRGKKREREDNSSTMAGIFYYQRPKERASIFSGWGKNYPENSSKIYNYHHDKFPCPCTRVNNVIKTFDIILSFSLTEI